MYICSCHAVTDGTIKAFAKEHGCNWRKLMRDTGVGTQCGTCAKFAKELLESESADFKPRAPRKRKVAAQAPEQTVTQSSPDPAAEAASGCCACSCGKNGCASLTFAEPPKSA